MKNPEKFWDRISKNYDNGSKKGTGKPSRPLLATKPYLSIDDTVLDYGCATGKKSIEISQFVKQVHGIDISHKMIEIALKKVETDEIKNVVFSKVEIFNEQLKPESFDAVVTYNVLHLIDNFEQAINRMYTLLKPGGYLISNTPCLGKNKSLWGTVIFIGNKLNLLPYVKMFKSNELADMFTKNNFEIIENKKLDQKDINNFIVAKKQ